MYDNASLYDFEPEKKEISQHITSGIVSSGSAQVIKILCQFASIIVLSRLLLPSDFGLIAMVSPIYAFIIIFHDLGLSQATIQKSAIRHDEVNAFFWLNVGVGIVLAVAAILLSPLIGWYYKDDRVIPLVMAMGLLILIGAFGTQHGAILQRRMRFKHLALIDMTGTLSGFATSVTLALIFKSYWALFCGMAVAVIVPVTGVWVASKWRPSLPKYVPGLRPMLKFGAGITSFNLTCFIAGNADNILIGRWWGDSELGFYDRAYKLLLFPLQRVVSPIGGTLIPLLSRLKDDPEKYCSIIHNTLKQLIFALWPGILWALMMSDLLIPAVLGKNWSGTVSVFVPLGIASLVQILNSTPIWIFLSQGRGGDYARWGVFNVITSVTAFVIGLPYGAAGVAAAYAFSEYFRTPFLWWYATRKGPVQISSALATVTPHIVSGIITAACLFYFHRVAQGHVLAVLAGSLAVSYLTFTLAMSFSAQGRETLTQSIIYIRHLLIHICPAMEKHV